MHGWAREINSFDSFMMCGAFLLGRLTLVRPGDIKSMLVDVCLIEVGFSKAAAVIDDVVEDVKYNRED